MKSVRDNLQQMIIMQQIEEFIDTHVRKPCEGIEDKFLDQVLEFSAKNSFEPIDTFSYDIFLHAFLLKVKLGAFRKPPCIDDELWLAVVQSVSQFSDELALHFMKKVPESKNDKQAD